MNVDAIKILYAFRQADATNLKAYIQCMTADRAPWASLTHWRRMLSMPYELATCVIIHILSGRKIVPREFQSGASLSDRDYSRDRERKDPLHHSPRPDKLTITDFLEATFVRHS